MAQTIGEYLYRIAWSLDKSGAANLRKEGDAAQKSVDGLGKSLDKTEQEAKDLSAAADKSAKELRDVGDASREATAESSKLNDTANAVTSSLKRMVAGLASIAAVKRAFSAIISTATEMDALANSAAAVGASASGMARLAYATDLAGVNASEMDSALKGVRQSAAQAAAGIGAGVKAWRLIGISTRDENGNLKDTTRLIDELGAKFAQMDEGRAQALGKMLKMTPAVIGALRSGMMDYAREFDQALGAMTPTFDEAVKAAQRLHSAQSRLVRIMSLLWQSIAARFFAPFEKAFDTIRTAIINNQAALARFGAAVLQPLALALSGVAESVSVVSNALSVLTSVFDALGPVAQSAVQTLLWGAAAYLLVLKRITVAQITAALTNPFVRIGAVIAGVLLLLDDFAVYMRGGKSYINWGPVADFVKKVHDFGAEVVDWFKALPDKISEAFKSFGDKIKAMWTDVVNWLSSKWDAFIKTVTGWMPDALKKQLGIKVEGDVNAPEIDRAAEVEQRRQTLLQTVYAGDPAGYEKATRDAEAAVDREISVRSQPTQVTQILETAPEHQALVKSLGGTPQATPTMPTMQPEPTPARRALDVALGKPEVKTPTPTPAQMLSVVLPKTASAPAAQQGTPASAPAAQLAAPVTGVVKLMQGAAAVAQGGQTLDRAQPLGSTNITNNVDSSKKYDIPVTVNNTNNVTITNMAADTETNVGQINDALDGANAKLVRDMQTPLAAIADESGNTMSTE